MTNHDDPPEEITVKGYVALGRDGAVAIVETFNPDGKRRAIYQTKPYATREEAENKLRELATGMQKYQSDRGLEMQVIRDRLGILQ